MGRRRIEMCKIEDNTKRVATFRKRKNGIFKKALELNQLTGAEISLTVVQKQTKFTYTTPGFDKMSRRSLDCLAYSEYGFKKKGVLVDDAADCDDGIFTDVDSPNKMNDSNDYLSEADISEDQLEEYLRALLNEAAHNRRHVKRASYYEDEGVEDPDFIPTPPIPRSIAFEDKLKGEILDAAFLRVIKKLQSNPSVCETFTALSQFTQKKRNRPCSRVRPRIKVEMEDYMREPSPPPVSCHTNAYNSYNNMPPQMPTTACTAYYESMPVPVEYEHAGTLLYQNDDQAVIDYSMSEQTTGSLNDVIEIITHHHPPTHPSLVYNSSNERPSHLMRLESSNTLTELLNNGGLDTPTSIKSEIAEMFANSIMQD